MSVIDEIMATRGDRETSVHQHLQDLRSQQIATFKVDCMTRPKLMLQTVRHGQLCGMLAIEPSVTEGLECFLTDLLSYSTTPPKKREILVVTQESDPLIFILAVQYNGEWVGLKAITEKNTLDADFTFTNLRSE